MSDRLEQLCDNVNRATHELLHTPGPTSPVLLANCDRALEALYAWIERPPVILRDVAEMPGFNPVASSRGDRSVSAGDVYWDDEGPDRVCCRIHRAMLCVNPERTLWRCIACGVGAYLEGGPP